MPTRYQITIDVEVADKEIIRETAQAMALRSMTEDEWEAARHDDPIGADVLMIFDPGISPDGTSIINAEVDCLEIDTDDVETCPECGAVEGSPEWGTVGDGYDGYCPSCADQREEE